VAAVNRGTARLNSADWFSPRPGRWGERGSRGMAAKQPSGGWSTRSEIAGSQVADFGMSCNSHIAAGSPAHWLQAFDHQTWIAARRTISYPLGT
jgi:hypothetical protein